MTRKSTLLAALLLTAIASTVAHATLGPLPEGEKIKEPFTNETCLEKCHGVKGFTGVGEFGKKRSMYITPEDYTLSIHGEKGLWCIDCHQGASPNEHPREGYENVDCRACHSEAPPAGVFPADALITLGKRKIEPPPLKALKGEGWEKTPHGKAYLEGNPKAPFCNDCHSAHSIRRTEDEVSTVNSCNLPKTCGKCHEGKVETGGVGGFLTRFRVSAHGKGDMRNRYSQGECVSCHQGGAAHGEENLRDVACPTCHAPIAKLKSGEVSETTSFHIEPAGEEKPFASTMSILYSLAFYGGALCAAILIIFFTISAIARRDGEE